jgi:Domain of unknown function (DUF5348)
MNGAEGGLSYGSGRYKLVGRAGRPDYYLHNGDRLEIYLAGRWLAVWIFFDGRRWVFEDKQGRVIERDLLGLPARQS